MNARAIQASFADYRTVKGRKMLQLVLEVPLERQGEVFAALGYPMPDQDRWCAVALLQDPTTSSADHPGAEGPQTPPPKGDREGTRAHQPPTSAPPRGDHKAKDLARSMAARTRFAELDEPGKLAAKAAMLAKDAKFIHWLVCHGHQVANPAQAKQWIRDRCGVESCSEFHQSSMACDRFQRIATDFELYAGALPEVRR